MGIYKLHILARNIHTTHFGTDTISSLEPKIWKLTPHKKTLTLSIFKSKIKSWSVDKCFWRLCKVFVKDFDFGKV